MCVHFVVSAKTPYLVCCGGGLVFVRQPLYVPTTHSYSQCVNIYPRDYPVGRCILCCELV